jgi:hypothetical protein
MGPHEAELSYPGSSVVAKAEGEAAIFEKRCSHRDYRL